MTNLCGFSQNYLEKRSAALSGWDVGALKNCLHEIKKNSIANLGKLRRRAVGNLQEFGVVVHETKTNDEARQVLSDLIPKGARIAKSKSNAINALEFKSLAGECSWDLTETDMGDFVVSLLGEGADHPVLPALGISVDEIWEFAEEQSPKEKSQTLHRVKSLTLGNSDSVPRRAEAVVRLLSDRIRSKILEAEFGLTGANAITATGQIVILENEGNISLVSRIPKVHVVVAGIEKIVPTIEDALHVCRCASLWGTGQKLATYINIISGPSKTADIENVLVTGAQGAQEVHLVLLDGWRSGFIGTEFEEFLYCINCGACFNTCPAFISAFKKIETLDPASCFDCTTCGACNINCPAKIDWEAMLKAARAKFVREGKSPKEFGEMIKSIRQSGNPFGKLQEGEIPDRLYCC